jgi:hypothetical protein
MRVTVSWRALNPAADPNPKRTVFDMDHQNKKPPEES